MAKKKEKKDKYEELGCEFMNEDECREEMDEEGESFEEAKKEHFKTIDEEDSE